MNSEAYWLPVLYVIQYLPKLIGLFLLVYTISTGLISTRSHLNKETQQLTRMIGVQPANHSVFLFCRSTIVDALRLHKWRHLSALYSISVMNVMPDGTTGHFDTFIVKSIWKVIFRTLLATKNLVSRVRCLTLYIYIKGLLNSGHIPPKKLPYQIQNVFTVAFKNALVQVYDITKYYYS